MSVELQRAIQQYAAQGFIVVHQTETTAQLQKPKQFSFAAFLILGILLFIVGAILYAAWYASQKDLFIYLSVDADGTVHATGTGLTAPSTPRNKWEAWAVGKSHDELVTELERARNQRAAPEYIHFLESRVAMHQTFR